MSLLWRPINGTTIEVNLDAPVELPYANFKVARARGTGWVSVQKLGDALFVNGRRVILHIEEMQKTGGRVRGQVLFDALEDKDVLHPNILDALEENTSLVPNSWNHDDQGRILYIYFLAVAFYGRTKKNLCVRCLYRRGDGYSSFYNWLDESFGDRFLAAVLESDT